MKKIILTILLIIGGVSIQAQNLHFGVKAGMNFNKWKISNEEDPGLDGKIGFDIGLLSEYMFNEKMGIGAEILYVDKGESGNIDGVDITYNTRYIEVPLLFKYYLTENFSLEAGPQLGIFLSSKMTVEDESDDFDDFINSTEFGFNLGANYKLNNGIFFNTRFTPGFTNILDNSADVDDTEIKNSTLRFGIGYYFK